MSDATHQEDETLIAQLRSALDQVDPVPADVTDFAKAALDWQNIDAVLANVEFDSSTEDLTSGVRSTTTARMLSFEVDEWTIDLEYHEPTSRLIGQVTPGQRCTVELHFAGGAIGVYSDDLGRFDFDNVLPGPASIVVRTSGDLHIIKTEWTVL
jgi:hypothetical protein